MFQFSAFASIRWHVFNMPGCPIRKSTDRVAFADPRGLSQLITSFIASESLGIPRVPLFTFFTLPPLLQSGRLLFGPIHKVWSLCCLLLLISFLPICQRTLCSDVSIEMWDMRYKIP